jgi:hypothetical protein
MSDESCSKSNRGWFPTGASGNYKGRPAGSQVPHDPVAEILVSPKMTVNGPGGPREIPLAEVIQWKTYQAALQGKAMAIRQVTKWFKKYQRWMAKHAPKVAPRPIARQISPDPDNADEALQLLGIARPNPARAHLGLTRAQLLLEPWSAQAALRRRRGGSRLTDGDRDEIRRSTCDPNSLRWPRGTDR